jgi:hypothetical protein
MNENYLAHYGIVGMKWGVRRFQPYSVRGRKNGETGKEIGEAKKKAKGPTHEQLLKSTNAQEVYKYRDRLSDRELRERVNRIQTEQQLQQLVSQSTKKGENAATKVLKNVESMAIAGISAYAFKKIKDVVKDPKKAIETAKTVIELAEWMATPWKP